MKPVTKLIDDLLTGYRAVDPDSRPMMRWWWFGPDLNRCDLDRQLQAMAEAGIGGVEVAFVYPLQAGETTFGSQPFLDDLAWAARRAADLGLRFDLTLGSGWSYGGGHIGLEHAARGLHWQSVDLDSTAADQPDQQIELALWPGEQLLGAYLGWAERRPTDPPPQQLTIEGTTVTVPAGPGVRRLWIASSRPTGQQVKRAARGAEGPVLDHYSAAALAHHLDRVASPMVEAIGAAPIGSVFCDSLEVYGSNWTPTLPAEFVRRRGYDLLPELPLLLMPGPMTEQEGDHRRVRADFHLTLAELYRENFLAPLTHWARQRGLQTRVQNYGTPPGTLGSWAEVDLPEGEGWGWAELTATRWASSAAHALGREVVSAEAFTWLHSPSLRATPLDLLGEAHEHLLNGVTQLVGHGWPYSPADAAAPGWLFYAAGCFDDRNPWWPIMPELTRYLARQCWLLRQGERLAQVAIVLPTRDLLSRLDRLDLFGQANAELSELVGRLRRHGVDYDLIDDELIAATQQPGVTSAEVVIVPFATELSPATLDWLQSLDREIWLIDSSIDIAPSLRVGLDELPSRLSAALPWATLEPTQIGSVRRRVDDHLVHWLANTTGAEQSLELPIEGRWWQISAATGEQVATGSGAMTVTLAAHQATVVITGVGAEKVVSETRTVSPADPEPWTELADWTFTGPQGSQPVQLPHRWEDDPTLLGFSGTASYVTSIHLDRAALIELDLGSARPRSDGPSPQRGIVGPSFRAACTAPVGEVAQIFVDDQPQGWLWAPPYTLSVTLDAGHHELMIQVTNSGANVLAAGLATLEQQVAAVERAHGRRFVMQCLDGARAGVSSGLFGLPRVAVAIEDHRVVGRPIVITAHCDCADHGADSPAGP